MARIALDAMGGDYAPVETVAGAVDAHREGADVVLVGDHDVLAAELAKHDTRLPIVDAPDVIGMGDDPSRALREKPGSSVTVAAKLVAEGSAAGFLSAGSTGAAMAAAAIIIGRLKGVARPPLATMIPTPGIPTLFLDMGANPDVRPDQLAQFGVMGAVAFSVLMDTENPRVAILSNGEEKGKGRDLEKGAYDLLERSGLNFVGNVEGRDVANDKADVIVTDGFTGNVFLKTLEGTAALMSRYTSEALATLPADVQAAVGPALGMVEKRLDYETYGGALLLGVRGVAVVAHGSSTRRSIAAALRMARDGAERDLPGKLAEQLG